MNQLLASDVVGHTGYDNTIKELQIVPVGNVAATDHTAATAQRLTSFPHM